MTPTAHTAIPHKLAGGERGANSHVAKVPAGPWLLYMNHGMMFYLRARHSKCECLRDTAGVSNQKLYKCYRLKRLRILCAYMFCDRALTWKQRCLTSTSLQTATYLLDLHTAFKRTSCGDWQSNEMDTSLQLQKTCVQVDR